MKVTENRSYFRFKIFQFMWLIFILFHMVISSPSWTTIGNNFLNPGNHFFLAVNFLVIVFSIASFLRPNKLFYFLLALISLTVVKLDALPQVPNHIILMLIINFTIFVSLLLYWDTSLKPQERISHWLDKTAPYLRLGLLIMYFFVVFHKLNYDYFNPAVSCSAELYTEIASILPFFPQGMWMDWIMIVMTLLLELAIPVLLLIPKTRILGVFTGLIFHFLLSLHHNLYILSFTAELYALFVLFLPDEIIVRIWKELKQRTEAINMKQILSILTCATILGIGSFIAIYIMQGGEINNVGELFLTTVQITWSIWCLLLIAGAAVIFRGRFFYFPQPSSLFKLSWSPLLLFPLLAVLNGITPYIGLKTATNFSMFSNLRVDGSNNNHLFMSSSCQVSDLQQDRVTLLNTNSTFLQDFIKRNERIPYFKLSKFLFKNRSKDIRVTYLRNDKKHTINLSHQKADTLLESSWLERKLLIFRGIPASGPTPCQW